MALVVSVLYRGSAIPVAWHILPANQKGPWLSPILDLLHRLAPAIPQTTTVLVLTDRGLGSPRLWQGIGSLGWHPLMRVKGNTSFQPLGGTRQPAAQLIPGPGYDWVGRGTAFRRPALRRCGTLLVVWAEDQAEPWLVLTDLPPEDLGVTWYGLRVWIELGFRALKGVGWQWQHTQRTNPDRIARHWLVLAVAMLWVSATEPGPKMPKPGACPRAACTRPPSNSFMVGVGSVSCAGAPVGRLANCCEGDSGSGFG